MGRRLGEAGFGLFLIATNSMVDLLPDFSSSAVHDFWVSRDLSLFICDEDKPPPSWLGKCSVRISVPYLLATETWQCFSFFSRRRHASGYPGLRCFDVKDGVADGWWIARPLVNQLLLNLVIFLIVPQSSRLLPTGRTACWSFSTRCRGSGVFCVPW